MNFNGKQHRMSNKISLLFPIIDAFVDADEPFLLETESIFEWKERKGVVFLPDIEAQRLFQKP